MTGNADQRPLVTVVMPAWRAAAYIGNSIESVLSQTYCDLELIVVDDHSPDDTVDIVRRYASRDPRVHLVSQPENRGPAAARNAAIQIARGRYLAFCDSDDLWLPEKLERQLEDMRSRQLGMSFTGSRRINQDGSRVGRHLRAPETTTYDELLGNTLVVTSTVVLDREMTGPFVMLETFYDDFVLWLSLLRKGVKAGGLPDDLVRYRVVKGSWSRNKGRSAAKVWQTYREVEKLAWPRAAVAFARYAVNGAIKYARF
jgi:teichuronic acid biosynthesis glycosyltransferase TuaG